MAKYIFVTGGVVSSIGKGVTASAMAQLLKSAGLKVFMQKFDPYINVDASHISPFEHGEIFITEDGAMTDLDLGHYERFIDENLNRHSSVTMGRIYQAVINKERNDEYQGTTVQVIPHITNQIKKKLLDVAKYTNADVVITEIGGTVGDIESTPFLEAIRQARIDFGYENTVFIHNTLIPYLKAANEIKTKPTQHSVNALRSLGIIPDVLVLRSERKIDEGLRAKLALYCDVHQEAIFESLDVSIIYEIIVNLHHQGIDSYLLKRLDFKSSSNDIAPWKELIRRIRLIKDEITIAIMGQYVSINDAYLSIIESLKHAGYECGVKIRIKWLDHSVQDMASIKAELTGVSGIIIAGERHDVKVLGMLLLIQYARLNDIPFFGLSLGMELALLEYAMH
ncbi:MAG: CTP synthase, partial [Erysipelotrichaceae bacterium]|nr:CTP synthase [Erysipelotrichaceae bacterium]